MSTRANIIIKDNDSKLIFYRHSDGYPDGTLPTLKKFMSWVRDERIRNNVNQASGWLILIGAKEYESVYIGDGRYEKKPTVTEPVNTDKGIGWKCGSYELTDAIHGDIEFLYTLDLISLSIQVQSVSNYNPKDGTTYKDGKSKMKTIATVTDFTDTENADLTGYDKEVITNPDFLEI